MARNYGVTVRAFNTSREQVAYARERAVRENLSGQAEFIEDDYRNITGKYDAFVSVGMLEHVGREHYGECGEVIRRCLVASGRGLLHFIGRNHPKPLNSWIRRRVFPGAYPPALREVMDVFETGDFSVLDVENLRLHYALTLEHWLSRYERSLERVVSDFGAEFARAWRLYLAGSVAAFRVGSLQLFQIVFAGAGNNRIPWTRSRTHVPDEGETRAGTADERRSRAARE
jgi:cyclopropane-fatty-acyl-phospholipid synthase